MDEFINWDFVNAAIVKYFYKGYTGNLEFVNAILLDYGNVIANKVDEIHSYAVKYKVNWQTENMLDVIQRLEEALIIKYGGLNKDALTVLKRCFSYNWK